jgi:hypothetical protein
MSPRRHPQRAVVLRIAQGSTMAKHDLSPPNRPGNS